MILYLYLSIFFLALALLFYVFLYHIADTWVLKSGYMPIDVRGGRDGRRLKRLIVYPVIGGMIFLVVFLVDHFNLYHFIPTFLYLQP